MIKGSHFILMVAGMAALQSVMADKITLKPYLTDIPTTQEDQDFLNYVNTYGKSYTSLSDFKFRREIYKRNKILRTQRQPQGASYQLADNFFSDQAPGEMATRFKYNFVKT